MRCFDDIGGLQCTAREARLSSLLRSPSPSRCPFWSPAQSRQYAFDEDHELGGEASPDETQQATCDSADERDLVVVSVRNLALALLARGNSVQKLLTIFFQAFTSIPTCMQRFYHRDAGVMT